MASSLKDRVTKRGTRTPPELGRVYALTHQCEVCQKSILPGHTWKFTSSGEKVHYYCGKQNPITDRACRYRANAHPPSGPKICAFCGAKQQIQVGHVDGHEENGEPENLIWTCRSCNMLHANTLRAAGLGRLTVQYNPAARGAYNLAQWLTAVMATKGGSDAKTVRSAVAMIRATPADDRSRFAYEIWRRRRSRAQAYSRNPISLDPRHFLRYGTVMKPAGGTKQKPGSAHGALERTRRKLGEAIAGSATVRMQKYKGERIWQEEDGWRVSLEPDSLFDSLKDAKRFVDPQMKNPGRRRIA